MNQKSLKAKMKSFFSACGAFFKKIPGWLKAIPGWFKQIPGRIKRLPQTMKNIHIQGMSFRELAVKMQENTGLMIFSFITSFLVMMLVCLVVFFVHVRGPEKVMVPDVTGKDLATALLEMQVKELYPKIQLRYSERPNEEGKILEQSPAAGAIVKGYSRVSLVVSRGVIIDHVDNFVGQKIDDVQMKIQMQFAGTTKPLIIIAEPEYKTDAADAGTILEQDPPQGTNITNPVTVHFVVSRGSNYETVKVPDLVGSTVNDVLQQMTRNKLVFDFTAHTAGENEKPGTVVKQEKTKTDDVRTYSHVAVEFALPAGDVGGNVYGIFEDELSEYPYAISVKLTAYPPEGDPYVIVSFNHPGGKCTIPYAVPHDTTLVLTAVEKEHKRMTVR